MKNKIPISWLSTLAYCENQIYLEHVQDIAVEPSPEMKKGKRVHAKLEEDHNKRATEKLTPYEAIKRAIEGKSSSQREVYVEVTNLEGSIDEVRYEPSQISIIDDKPTNTAFPSHKLQVWGYCLAFQEHYKANLPLISCIRNRDSQEIIWDDEFSEDNKRMVLESVERILGILNGSREPEPTNEPNRCKKCRLNNACDIHKLRFK
jgi:CRISPR-associated protein Cas4